MPLCYSVLRSVSQMNLSVLYVYICSYSSNYVESALLSDYRPLRFQRLKSALLSGPAERL